MLGVGVEDALKRVEGPTMRDAGRSAWRRSSRCESSGCVEVAVGEGTSSCVTRPVRKSRCSRWAGRSGSPSWAGWSSRRRAPA